MKSNNKCLSLVLDFFNKQKKYKQIQKEFEDSKRVFYSKIDKYFKEENIDKMVFDCEGDFEDSTLEVNRIQKTNVIFDIDKVEKRLGKNISEDIVINKYEINDMTGLIAYLKECNVDPKIFKSFLTISKSLDLKELERLEELGKISKEQLKGCYKVKMQKPYFTVRMKRGQDDNGAKEW